MKNEMVNNCLIAILLVLIILGVCFIIKDNKESENIGNAENTIKINETEEEGNIIFANNYENAENHGYYWIDDCDYGKTIEFIPDDPIREGYEFGGWYKEPECINKWDFETDTLPPTKTQLVDSTTNDEPIYQETVIVYQETRLYAQWVEKN